MSALWHYSGNDRPPFARVPGPAYPSPKAPYEAIADHFCVYPGRAACFVDGERVMAQDGGFYGGWVTGEIVGPWKGATGTTGW